MSELEVRRARMDVEKSAAELERALDRLHEQVEEGVQFARELGAKAKEPSALPRKLMDEFIDDTVEYAKHSANGLFRDLRASAEDELQSLDKHALLPWAAVFTTGLVLGYFLARHPGSRSSSSASIAV